MTHASATNRIGLAALTALGVAWGANFVFMQNAAPYITPAQTTLLRVVFGVVPILLFSLATRAMSWSHLRHVHHFAVQAVLAASFYYYAYVEGSYRLDTSIAAMLSASIPVFAAIGALVIFRTEVPTARKVIAVLVGAIGVIVLAKPWDVGELDVAGVWWMLAGSASLGFSYGYARRFVTPLKVPAAASATYQMLIASIGLLLVTDLSGITAIGDDVGVFVGVALGLGVSGTGIAFVLYYIAVNRLGAIAASSATYIALTVAVIIGVVLLDETLDSLSVAAVGLLGLAAWLAQARQR